MDYWHWYQSQAYNTLAMRSRNYSYNNNYTLAKSVVSLDKLDAIANKIVYENIYDKKKKKGKQATLKWAKPGN